MGSLSVRGVDKQLNELLKKQAKASEKSVNQLVVEILKRAVGLEKEKKFTGIHTDLDHLFGTWTKEEYDLVQGKVDLERRVDGELWK